MHPFRPEYQVASLFSVAKRQAQEPVTEFLPMGEEDSEAEVCLNPILHSQ
ncbi:hypothetical protein GCM10011357_22920 [Lacimicrobium alkaliphilum]|uniref:Uncharacterized protein n=1 Tax=Lacimicrobium alkaliphilum TaxID=1526571 RepID=A0ABQ1RHH8_9ALTE|nr:hypothetical protein GCM10011357_22920 [Lacimicrobium alkaliphilum]